MHSKKKLVSKKHVKFKLIDVLFKSNRGRIYLKSDHHIQVITTNVYKFHPKVNYPILPQSYRLSAFNFFLSNDY